MLHRQQTSRNSAPAGTLFALQMLLNEAHKQVGAQISQQDLAVALVVEAGDDQRGEQHRFRPTKQTMRPLLQRDHSTGCQKRQTEEEECLGANRVGAYLASEKYWKGMALVRVVSSGGDDRPSSS